MNNFRNYFIRAMTILLLYSSSAMAAQTGLPGTEVFGKWKVSRILDTADIVGISEREAKALLGKTINISKDGFQFNGMTCKAPSYQQMEQDPVRYLRETWHSRSGNLGLPDPVIVISARCTDIFIKSKDTIVFNWDGFFFDATRK